VSSIAGFHYHFYQPPREDPWTGLTTHEWSAWPYHDWNERITAECYRALLAVSLSDEDGNSSLFEPLAQSSFDLGPTLHHWIARHAPDVDGALLRQVRRANKGPRGVVMAAPLVHAIVPLASPTDQERLVAWGIDDYRRRYGDEPLGFWLPETAVDQASLEVLARHGVSYTVLMPTQARRVRSLEGEWSDVTPETLDTSRAYVVRLASGGRIKVVFGNFDLSHRAAFGDLLADGDAFADALADVVATAERDVSGRSSSEVPSNDGRDVEGGAVALVVADGETYGHHHRFGDLGVAWATRRLQQKYQLSTTLGDWLEDHEPEHEVELHEVSAWSCAHGVERWRSACGCVTGERAGFDLEWRAPLRRALDWLRENGGAALDWELGHHVHASGHRRTSSSATKVASWTRMSDAASSRFVRRIAT
jgi:Glycosyl hydrolase family 57